MIDIVVDKRIEFIGLVLKLSKYSEVYPFLKNKNANKDYNDELERWFGKFRDSGFIKLINQIIVEETDFCYGTPFQIMLRYFDKDFNFVDSGLEDKCSKIIHTKAGQKFIKRLKTFAQRINFDSFYNAQENFYQSCIDFVNSRLRNIDVENYFKAFYGISRPLDVKCNLYFTDSSSGGFGLCEGDRLYPTVYATFDENGQMCPVAASFLFHEMSHPIINPLTDKYCTQELNFADKLKIKYYGQEKHIINEYIIRAGEVIYFKNRNASEEFLDRKIEKEKASGFTEIEKVVSLYEEYTQNRDKFKTIEDFYPKLLSNLLDVINTGENNCADDPDVSR